MVIHIETARSSPMRVRDAGGSLPGPRRHPAFILSANLPHRCSLQCETRPPIPQSGHSINSGALAKLASVKCIWTNIEACMPVGWNHTTFGAMTSSWFFVQATTSFSKSRAFNSALISPFKSSCTSKHLGGADTAKASVSSYERG